MKRLEVVVLPLDEMLVHRMSLPRNLLGLPQQFTGTNLYTWVERATVRVKCLAHKAVASGGSRGGGGCPPPPPKKSIFWTKTFFWSIEQKTWNLLKFPCYFETSFFIKQRRRGAAIFEYNTSFPFPIVSHVYSTNTLEWVGIGITRSLRRPFSGAMIKCCGRIWSIWSERRNRLTWIQVLRGDGV